MSDVLAFTKTTRHKYRNVDYTIKIKEDGVLYFIHMRDIYGSAAPNTTVYGDALTVQDCKRKAETRIDEFLETINKQQKEGPQEYANNFDDSA